MLDGCFATAGAVPSSLALAFPFTSQATAPETGLGVTLVALAPAGPGHASLGLSGRSPDELDEEPPDFGNGDQGVAGTRDHAFSHTDRQRREGDRSEYATPIPPPPTPNFVVSETDLPLASLNSSSNVQQVPAVRTIFASQVVIGAQSR